MRNTGGAVATRFEDIPFSERELPEAHTRACGRVLLRLRHRQTFTDLVCLRAPHRDDVHKWCVVERCRPTETIVFATGGLL